MSSTPPSPPASLVAAAARALPPLPRAGSAPDLNPGQRRAMVAGITALHLVAGWGLLQVSAVREAVLQAAPMFVDLITPEAPPAPPTPPPPPPRQPVVQPLPLPVPIVAAAPSPAPAAFVVPALPAPEPPPAPAPPAPVVVAAPAPPAPPPAPKLIPASAVQYLQPPEVVYPRLSRRSGEAGLVVVRAYVDTTGGAPRSLQINQSSGHVRLDEAALAAVQKARFKPYTENGQPVEGWALIPIHFELEK